MHDEQPPTPAIDVERPSAARIYDYYLGGAHNFEADRQVAEQVIARHPDIRQMAQVNRAFLRRAVNYLTAAGVRQFLDIGSGIPSADHVHEVAQRAAPDARVVYVDVDPVAVAHSREILANNRRATVIQEDVRRPQHILEHSEVHRLLDLDRPVAVLTVALLHFIPDAEDPAGLLARLTRPLVAGSHLVITHATDEGSQSQSRGDDLYRNAGIDVALRTREEVRRLFGDFDPVEPGLVWVPQWRPESPTDLFADDPRRSAIYAGVGRRS